MTSSYGYAVAEFETFAQMLFAVNEKSL